MSNVQRITIEVDPETQRRLSNLMKILGLSDMDSALNKIMEQVELRGWERRKEALDEIERIFTLECPYMNRNVSLANCEDCPHCQELDKKEGCVVCSYGQSRELEFMTSCPRIRSTATVVSCVDCRLGKVSGKYGTVVCRYLHE